MEDVLTEIPPPSRFYQDELNNFAPPSPPIPSPFLLFSNPNPNRPLRPSFLIIALSNPSLYIFHNLSSKKLIGTLILPETHFSGNSIEPSLRDKSCNIYSLNGDDDNSVIVVSVQCPVSAERSHVAAKLLIGGDISPQRVVVFDAIQSRNFRGKLSPDETLGFKLETSSERKGVGGGLKGLEYFPSGSVVDGLGAALLGRCQMKNIKGSLCVTWPEFGVDVVSLVKSLLVGNLLPGLDLSIGGCDGGDEFSGSGQIKDHFYDSELYT
ncbi:hypothetical protein FEM48_Zijuj10G0026200 [Ziziphus jujuba var. spinosa]|uniref:uncharacterized protein LOC107428056 n=2 Tax=Ziziphus jujuba TaxID=326968 RepID=A0A6P6GHR7_ZIZJJ|nr:uncharacterized protein LOC107428056 [Ziziphus jujuba var. spinosa]KAH7515437.1 hypothetical protein FEM48_Zijuj10G0026200 [Ziziphus jujuba var. spinosa]